MSIRQRKYTMELFNRKNTNEKYEYLKNVSITFNRDNQACFKDVNKAVDYFQRRYMSLKLLNKYFFIYLIDKSINQTFLLFNKKNS